MGIHSFPHPLFARYLAFGIIEVQGSNGRGGSDDSYSSAVFKTGNSIRWEEASGYTDGRRGGLQLAQMNKQYRENRYSPNELSSLTQALYLASRQGYDLASSTPFPRVVVGGTQDVRFNQLKKST